METRTRQAHFIPCSPRAHPAAQLRQTTRREQRGARAAGGDLLGIEVGEVTQAHAGRRGQPRDKGGHTHVKRQGPGDAHSTLEAADEDGSRRYVGLDYVDVESFDSWRGFLGDLRRREASGPERGW